MPNLKPMAFLSALGATVGHLVSIGWVDAFLYTVWSQSGTLFTGLSIASTQLAPTTGLPAGVLESAALAAGIVFLSHLAYEMYQRFRINIENDSD